MSIDVETMFFDRDVTQGQGWYQMTRLSISFDLIYNMYGFDVICRKLCFLREVVNFNWTSFCVQGNPRLEIENLGHPWPCFDAMKLTVTSNLAKGPPFNITFFEARLEISFFVKN